MEQGFLGEFPTKLDCGVFVGNDSPTGFTVILIIRSSNHSKVPEAACFKDFSQLVISGFVLRNGRILAIGIPCGDNLEFRRFSLWDEMEDGVFIFGIHEVR